MQSRVAIVLLLISTCAAGKEANSNDEDNWIHKPLKPGEYRLLAYAGALDSTPESQAQSIINAGVAKGTSGGIGAEYVFDEEWAVGVFANVYQYKGRFKDIVDRSFGAYLSQAIYTDEFLTIYGSGGLSYHDFRLFTGSVKTRVGYFDAALGIRAQMIDSLQVGFESRYSVVVNPLKGLNIQFRDETIIKGFKYKTWQFALGLIYQI
jgi:hypothetical protein